MAFEQVGPAPQDADPGRAHHLVGREGEEVDAEVAHVDRRVRHQLRPVGHHHGAGPVGCVGDQAHRRDGPEDVRHGRHADHLDAVDQRLEVIQDQPPGIVDRDVAQLEAAELLRQDHPRHDVGVVLHFGQEHRVTGPQVRTAPRLGDQVERLGRVLGEDHLVRRVRGVDEAPGHHAGPLVQGGGLLGGGVDAAVHVGVGRLVVARHGADDGLGLQRRRRRVQVDDGPAVHRPGQQGEVLTQRLDVERRRSRRPSSRRPAAAQPSPAAAAVAEPSEIARSAVIATPHILRPPPQRPAPAPPTPQHDRPTRYAPRPAPTPRAIACSA